MVEVGGVGVEVGVGARVVVAMALSIYLFIVGYQQLSIPVVEVLCRLDFKLVDLLELHHFALRRIDRVQIEQHLLPVLHKHKSKTLYSIWKFGAGGRRVGG